MSFDKIQNHGHGDAEASRLHASHRLLMDIGQADFNKATRSYGAIADTPPGTLPPVEMPTVPDAPFPPNTPKAEDMPAPTGAPLPPDTPPPVAMPGETSLEKHRPTELDRRGLSQFIEHISPPKS
jgi:hypothetical protein